MEIKWNNLGDIEFVSLGSPCCLNLKHSIFLNFLSICVALSVSPLSSLSLSPYPLHPSLLSLLSLPLPPSLPFFLLSIPASLCLYLFLFYGREGSTPNGAPKFHWVNEKKNQGLSQQGYIVRRAYATSVPGKIEPLGFVHNGIAEWRDAPEDDLVLVDPYRPQCGKDLPPIRLPPEKASRQGAPKCLLRCHGEAGHRSPPPCLSPRVWAYSLPHPLPSIRAVSPLMQSWSLAALPFRFPGDTSPHLTYFTLDTWSIFIYFYIHDTSQ